MKPRAARWILLAAMLCVAILLAVLIATAPKHPVARIRVVDMSGRPVPGAVIQPEGLRTKPGPYQSGWYTWRPDVNRVPNPPVTTDQDGYADIPHPKYVFEKIETGTLCLSVGHPDFVPCDPERIVATALPSGAPWRLRVQDLWGRIRHKALMTHPDPVVLQKGAILKVTVPDEVARVPKARLFVQVAGLMPTDEESWIRPGPGVILTRRLAAGPHTVRAVVLDSNGATWFSDVVPITAAIGQTNELVMQMKPGVVVRGRLDDSVPHPVRNGRVIAHVWTSGEKPQENPPQWHAWASVREDGSFTINSLPSGDLEVVALCDGFISTNGPGQSSMRYPQKHVLGTNDLAIAIGMEPTARLEVKVTDEAGRPLEGVHVSTWPNVRYGEWSAVILGSDCYNMSGFLLGEPAERRPGWRPVPDFEGVSDTSGLAVLANLPADVNELAAEHPAYALPIVTSPGGRKVRQASFTLGAGQTNHLSLRLEPRDESTITHY